MALIEPLSGQASIAGDGSRFQAPLWSLNLEPERSGQWPPSLKCFYDFNGLEWWVQQDSNLRPAD